MTVSPCSIVLDGSRITWPRQITLWVGVELRGDTLSRLSSSYSFLFFLHLLLLLFSFYSIFSSSFSIYCFLLAKLIYLFIPPSVFFSLSFMNVSSIVLYSQSSFSFQLHIFIISSFCPIYRLHILFLILLLHYHHFLLIFFRLSFFCFFFSSIYAHLFLFLRSH